MQPKERSRGCTPPFDKITGHDFTVINADAFDAKVSIPDNTIDACITDPPYFIDGMGGEWDGSNLSMRASKASVVGGLPTSMRFTRKQGADFEAFTLRISKELFRTLKPGAFFICLSQPRLCHHMAVAIENAGFEIRDGMAWVRTGQAKAFSQNHFVRKRVAQGRLSPEQGDALIASMGGRKTPQLRPVMEWMLLAQKPLDGTYVENWDKWGVGLVDTTQSLDAKFPSTLMTVARDKRDEGNSHLTPKPVALIEHLIRLFTTEGQTVLDPFFGSGSHGVAAISAGRKIIGIEIDSEYAAIARARLEAVATANGESACRKRQLRQQDFQQIFQVLPRR